MSGTFAQRLQWFDNNPALLRSLSLLQRGVEKESLRVNENTGVLAQNGHPKTLGSALCHPKITTDYSEALLEFITPVFNTIPECLQCLTDIHHFTYQQLAAQNEMLWTHSMPCVLGKTDNDIPIALYGSSNVGKMKSVYRLGLGHRYGRAMQTISGIHYNFSLSDRFWAKYQQQHQDTGPLSTFKTEHYFRLMRNFRRYVPLFVYLFGSSPALSSSFLKGQKHNLKTLDNDTFYGEYATSLRMGDLGYQSNAQNALFVCYNNLDNYVNSLRRGITEPHADYEKIGLKDKDGNYQQLNTSLLQIENEFYSPIRPKRVTASGEAPINALQRGGVEYIEVRCIDVSPFASVGITAATMRFLDTFLLYCLLEDSPEFSSEACNEASENLRRVVNEGRKPGLELSVDGKAVLFSDWANNLLQNLRPLAAILDKLNATGRHMQSLEQQQEKVNNPELTPSAQFLAHLRDEQLSYTEFALKQSRHWQAHFLNKPLSEETRECFVELAADSIAQQKAIEAADTLSFDAYIEHFYQQYRK